MRYRITGKQRFGAQYADGRCIAVFDRHTAETDSAEDAKVLKKLGYTVEPDPTTRRKAKDNA